MANLPFTGFAATGCSACSSSLGSIALGISLLKSGQLDLVIAGGYDTISEYVYAGFNSLRLVAPGALRPFTKDRLGMKLAEGYGIVVLERADDAAARGAAPLATILGYGESADAHHLTQPHPQGEGAARAISAALKSAGLTPAQIDLVAAHATGTPDNDAGEYAALRSVFGDDLPRVPVVAFKSHLGHTLGGAGAVELILSTLCLRDQIVPGCANIRAEEIEFSGLNVATGPARPARIRATLNTSLGFGGANTCVVLGMVEEASGGLEGARANRLATSPSPGTLGEGWGGGNVGKASPQGPLPTLPRSTGRGLSEQHISVNPVHITGIGVVLPGMIGNDAFIRAITAADVRPATRDSGPLAESEYIDLLNARRVRRMSDYVKLSLAATMLACRDAKITDIPSFAATCSALLGSTHGSANYSEAYYQQIVREGIAAANPMLFAEGVPNAGAAHLSLMLSLKGPCQTIIGTRTAGLDALHLAALRISTGEWDRAIVSAAEEYSPLVNSAYEQWGLHSRGEAGAPFSNSSCGFVAGCGAMTFVLESERSMQERGATPRGRVLRSTGPISLPEKSRYAGRDLLERLGEIDAVVSSANGTWIDRLEAIAIGRAGGISVSSLAGYLPEIHSVMPLAGIAAVLLTGRVPRLLGGSEAGEPARNSQSPIRNFGVICSDYTGLLSAAAIGVG
jgi:3-oxoacyl-[acyl-carrier-protein] synthase II